MSRGVAGVASSGRAGPGRQAFGRRPWLALLFLRALRRRAFFPTVIPLVECGTVPGGRMQPCSHTALRVPAGGSFRRAAAWVLAKITHELHKGTKCSESDGLGSAAGLPRSRYEEVTCRDSPIYPDLAHPVDRAAWHRSGWTNDRSSHLIRHIQGARMPSTRKVRPCPSSFPSSSSSSPAAPPPSGSNSFASRSFLLPVPFPGGGDLPCVRRARAGSGAADRRPPAQRALNR